MQEKEKEEEVMMSKTDFPSARMPINLVDKRNEDVVKIIKKALNEAEKGKLFAIAIVGLSGKGEVTVCWAHNYGGDRLIGALERLKHGMIADSFLDK